MPDFVLVSIANGTFACAHCSESPVDTSRHSCQEMLDNWARSAARSFPNQSDKDFATPNIDNA
jgi:hypothetical protein